MAELRTLAIQIPEPMYEALVRKARAAGMTPAVYARCLLDAAYSVRVGAETQDRELAAAVSRVFARPPSPGKGEGAERGGTPSRGRDGDPASEAGGGREADAPPHPAPAAPTSPPRGEVKKEGGAAPVVHLVAERPLAPAVEASLGAMVTAAAAAMHTETTPHPAAPQPTLGSEPEGRLSPAGGEVTEEAAPLPPPASIVPSAAMRRRAGARARSRGRPVPTSTP